MTEEKTRDWIPEGDGRYRLGRENLMNQEHKTTNEKYREGYDRIEWDRQRDSG